MNPLQSSALLLAVTLFSSGCAKFTANRTPATSAEVDGLRVQLPEQHRVVVLVQDGDAEKLPRWSRPEVGEMACAARRGRQMGYSQSSSSASQTPSMQ